MTLGPTTEIVASALAGARARAVSSDTRSVLDEILTELELPLRIAVTGRVNAGKSTLVNALLRQRIAPTDVSECTKFAAWFRFGAPERVEVVGPDGTRRAVALRADGRLPAAIGDLNDHDVSRIDVFLSNDSLRAMTLIDTPGLASARDDVQRADEVLALDRRTRLAIAQADALVFVLAGNLRAGDTGMIDEFRRLTKGLTTSSINTVAVLSRIDQLVDLGDDPLVRSAARCEDLARRLRTTVSGVYPVVGLLAETAESGVVTESDLTLVRRMVADASAFDRSLVTVDRFARADALGGTAAQRERLLELLDLHGLHVLARRIGAADVTTRELVDELRARSGIDLVRDAIIGELAGHADLVKASWAVGSIQDLAFRVAPDDRDLLLDLSERLELDPAMHRVAEIAVLREIAGGLDGVAAIEADEVRRLVHANDPVERVGAAPHTDPGDARAIAVASVNRWRTVGNDASSTTAVRSIAAVLARSYELLAAELGALR